MIHLEKLFENFFDSKLITPLRLNNFAADHLGKLINANPGGVYDTNIADTTAKLTAFQAAFDLKVLETAEREGTTKGKKKKRTLIQEFLSDKEGLIRSTFGKDSDEYEMFFPQGLTAFSQATDTGFLSMVNAVVSLAATYETQLGLAFKTEITNLRNAYVTARGAQAQDITDVTDATTDQKVTLHDLQIQLCVNIYSIGLQALPNGDATPELIVETYFNESLLYGHQFRHIYKITVAANSEKVACTFVYHPTNHLDIMHKSASPLTYQMSLNGVLVGNVFTTHIGEKLHRAFEDFAADGDALVVTNAADVEGECRIVLLS